MKALTSAVPVRTGHAFDIGKLFHIIHMSDVLAPLDDWYDQVFFPRRGIMDKGFLATVKRDGSLIAIADTMIETMSPSQVEGAEHGAAGKFLARYGRHWHSLAWYVDDVGAAWDFLDAAGIRMVSDEAPRGQRPPSGALYTHAADTLVQIELYERRPYHPTGEGVEGVLPDPRLFPGWADDWWATNHPLGLRRMSYATVLTDQPARAATVFGDLLGGRPIHEGASALTGTRSTFYAVGPETVVEVAEPAEGRGEGSLAAADLAAVGSSCHAVAFEVVDLDATARQLERLGIGIVGRDDETLVTDPADCFGAPFRFTTWSVPGDPRDGV